MKKYLVYTPESGVSEIEAASVTLLDNGVLLFYGENEIVIHAYKEWIHFVLIADA